MWLATLFSILNKIFDLAPPLLIGAAVDVVGAAVVVVVVVCG